jgi:hypothetical protein
LIVSLFTGIAAFLEFHECKRLVGGRNQHQPDPVCDRDLIGPGVEDGGLVGSRSVGVTPPRHAEEAGPRLRTRRAERNALSIPINAKVICTDGLRSQTVCVVIDPVSDQIVHMVTHGKTLFVIERLRGARVETAQAAPLSIACNMSEARKSI